MVLKYDLLVARFDTNLRPLWVRTVPDSLPNENYGPVGSHVEIDAYGGVLVSGSPYFYAWTKPMGFAARLDRRSGALRWYREYWHEMPGDHSWIDTFYERPDSGFIHGGSFFNLKTVPRDNRLYYWLFGTDKYGCDSAGCHTIGLAEQYQDLQLQVFPNPSRGRFLLSGDLGRFGRGAQLHLYDPSGRERASAILPGELGANAEFYFNLAQGLYFVHITAGDGRPVAVLPWVVEP